MLKNRRPAAPLSLGRRAIISNVKTIRQLPRSNLITLQEEDNRSQFHDEFVPDGLSRVGSTGTGWVTVRGSVADTLGAQIDGTIPEDELWTNDTSTGPPLAGVGRGRLGLMHNKSVASMMSGVSGMSMATVHEGDLFEWRTVFDADKLKIPANDMDALPAWLAAGDVLAFSSPSSDRVVFYDGQNPMWELVLPGTCDRWQLAPDAKHLIYSQGQLINIYSLTSRRLIISERLPIPPSTPSLSQSPSQLHPSSWTTLCQTSTGILLLSLSGEAHFLSLQPSPTLLIKPVIYPTSRPMPPSTQINWSRCHSAGGNWACTFSHYPGRHAAHVRVYNAATGEVQMFKGIAAVVGNLIVNGVTHEVLVLLDRERGALKMSCHRLDYAEDIRKELHTPPASIPLASPSPSIHLLFQDPTQTILLIVDGVARTFDALSGKQLGSDEVVLGEATGELRADHRGTVLRRTASGLVQRLEVNRTRLAAYRT